jgi:hypothetical protein
MSDEENLKWEIDAVRESIRQDWTMLASKDLAAEQRKAIKEHLLDYVHTLEDLVKRNQSVSQKMKVEKFKNLRRSNLP